MFDANKEAREANLEQLAQLGWTLSGWLTFSHILDEFEKKPQWVCNSSKNGRISTDLWCWTRPNRQNCSIFQNYTESATN